jgi:hypothetical protein
VSKKKDGNYTIPNTAKTARDQFAHNIHSPIKVCSNLNLKDGGKCSYIKRRRKRVATNSNTSENNDKAGRTPSTTPASCCNLIKVNGDTSGQ